MPFRFADTAAERAFQLHYGALPVAFGLATVAMGAFVHVTSFARAALLPSAVSAAAFHTQQTVVSLASIILYLGHYALVGKQQFIFSRGFHTVWHRVLYATGLLSWIKPLGCAAAGCHQMLWQHRLFLVHFVGALTRIPSGWYWFGGLLSWLAMGATVVVDPDGGCWQSAACLVSALQAAAAANKWLLLHNILLTTLHTSRVFATDVVLPGLLLTWLEMRARRAWWQQQQQQQQARQQQVQLQLRDEAAQHKEQQAAVAAGLGCCSSQKAAPEGTLRQQQRQHAGSLDCALEADQAVHCATDDVPASKSAAATALTSAPPSCRDSSQRQPALQPVLPAPMLQGATGASAAGALTEPPAPAAAVAPPPAAAAPWHAAAVQPAGHPLLYRSPVGRRLVSFKFNAAPGGLQDNALFGRQLAGAVQAAATAALVALEIQAANAAAGAHNAPAVLASDFAAFPGCHQVVLHLVLPQEYEQLLLLGSAAEQQLQQAVEAAAQQAAAAWPECGGLQDVQLQQQQESTVHSAAAAPEDTAMPDQPTAAAAVDAATGHEAGTAGLTSTTALQAAAAAGIFLQPVVLTDSSSSSSSSSEVEIELHLTPAAVQLLQAADWQALRVVVSAAHVHSPAPSTTGAGVVLLDQAWLLHDMGLGAVGNAQLPLRLRLPGADTPQALSVIVLHGASTTPAEQATAAAGFGDEHAAVVAKLPLLQLPLQAAAELQQLYAALMQHEHQAAAAYHQLLPLLQDLAVVVWNSQHGGEASQHKLHRAMLAALQECCVAHKMEACQQLLVLLGTSSHVDDAAGAAQGSSSQQVVPASSRTPAAGATDDIPAGAKQATGQAVDTRHFTSANTSPSTSTNPSTSTSTTSRSSSTRSSSSRSTSSSSAASSRGPATGTCSSKSSSAMEALHCCDAGAVPDAACRVSAWSVLFGLPDAASQAYASFKCTRMVGLDVVCIIIYAIELVPTVKAFVLEMLAHDSSPGQLLAAGYRVLFVVISLSTRLLVLAAGMRPQHFGYLHRWRNTLLLGSLSAVMVIPMVGVMCGGVWRSASLAAMHGYYSSPWMLVVYRHVVEPTLVCVGLLPSLLFLAQCVLVAGPLFGQPQLLGVGPVPTALLLVVAHLGVAVNLEVGMQRKFARHVASSRRQRSEERAH